MEFIKFEGQTARCLRDAMVSKLSDSGVSAEAGVCKPKRRLVTEEFKKGAVQTALKYPPGKRIKPTCDEYVDESGTRRFEPRQLRTWMSKYGPEVGTAAGLSDAWIGVVGASAEAPDPAEQVYDATASAVSELPPPPAQQRPTAPPPQPPPPPPAPLSSTEAERPLCAKRSHDTADCQKLKKAATALPTVGGSAPAPLAVAACTIGISPLQLIASVTTTLTALALGLCGAFIARLNEAERALLNTAIFHGTLHRASTRGSSALPLLEPDDDGRVALRAGTLAHEDAQVSFSSGGRHSRVNPALPLRGPLLWAARSRGCRDAMYGAILHTLQRGLAAGRGPFCISLIVLTANHASNKDFFDAAGRSGCAVTSCSRAVLREPDSGTGGGDELADTPGWLCAELAWKDGTPACQLPHNTALTVDPLVAAAAAAAAGKCLSGQRAGT